MICSPKKLGVHPVHRPFRRAWGQKHQRLRYVILKGSPATVVLGKVNLSYVDALPQLGHAYDVGSTIYSIKESHFSVSSSPQGKLLQDNREGGQKFPINLEQNHQDFI